MENQFAIRGDLGDRVRDDVVRLASEQVELPDTSVRDITLESLLNVREQAVISRPRRLVRGAAIQAQTRDDPLGRTLPQHERALVRRARDERFAYARPIEQGQGVINRIQSPCVAVVVDVGVEDRQVIV